jgi:hypothetical protein
MPAFELNTRQTAVKKSKGGKPKTGPGTGGGAPAKGIAAVSRKGGVMDPDTFQGALAAAIQDAEDYIDGYIAPLRATATAFYRGEPFGNEEHGRSQVVMTEVRDATLAILPSLMRIFTSADHVVEFIPCAAPYIEQAEQQTALVDHVFMQDNPGFLNLYSAFKDALVRKVGVMKWRWSDDITITQTAFTGLQAEMVAVFQRDKSVQVLSVEESDRPDDPEGMPPTYDVRIQRIVPRNRVVIECLPPEEFIIARDARDIETAAFVAHRSYKTVSDLVAMGFDKSEVIENMGGADMFSLNYEAQARNPAVLDFMTGFDTPDESMRRVLTFEAYMRIDKDGDGIAELRKIIAIGDAYHVLDDEIVDEAPFALFCPDPEPHMVVGQSVADQTMDLQMIKSNMVRNLLDSLAGSIHPRTVVVEGRVNLDDALNTEQGAIIRTKDISAVNELVKPFVGQEALTVMAYVDQIKSKRTGVTDASQGLDPQILQSATHAAVSATVSGAQERIELYARIFAETGMKRLFRGVAKLLRENQDAARIIKLNGTWVPVEPRAWVGDLECQPNVALGKGTDQDKINFLALIASKQELAIQTLGPMNPIAGIDKWANTMRQATVLGGFKDASRYFGQVTPEFMAQLAQPNQQPDPATMMVEVEKMKVELQHMREMLKIQQDGHIAAAKDDLERDRIRVNALTQLARDDASHERELHQAAIEAQINDSRENARLRADHTARLHEAALNHIAQTRQQDVNAETAKLQASLKAEVSDRDSERRAQAASAAAPGDKPKKAKRPAKGK